MEAESIRKTKRAQAMLVYANDVDVDNHGNVQYNGKKLRTHFDKDGYLLVYVKGCALLVHQLIAHKKFGVAALMQGTVVRHLDGNRLNNAWDNIAIGTPSDNTNDIPPEVRSERVRKGRANMPKERKTLIAKKASAGMTSEQRSTMARAQWAKLTPEERSEKAKLGLANVPAERRSSFGKAGAAAFSAKYTTEQRRMFGIKGNQKLTHEERSQRYMKALITKGFIPLSDEELFEIRRLYATGNHTYNTLADMFAVSRTVIVKVIKRVGYYSKE